MKVRSTTDAYRGEAVTTVSMGGSTSCRAGVTRNGLGSCRQHHLRNRMGGLRRVWAPHDLEIAVTMATFSSNPSLARVGPVSVSTENSAGKTFAENRDRGGIFGDTSRLRATETVLSSVCGFEATES
jgi:hypothetical protein